MIMKKKLVFLISLILIPFSLFAQFGDVSQNVFGIGGQMILPLEIGRTIQWAVSGKIKLTPQYAIFLDLILDKGFYYFDDGEWQGPTKWGNIESESSSGEWLFYHTEVNFNINFGMYFPYGNLQPFVALGPYFTFYANPESEVLANYPEFEEKFDQVSEDTPGSIGLILRGGLDYFPIIRHFSIGFEAFFKIESLSNFASSFGDEGISYLGRRFYISINAMGWI
jgi:hypothetical protein